MNSPPITPDAELDALIAEYVARPEPFAEPVKGWVGEGVMTRQRRRAAERWVAKTADAAEPAVVLPHGVNRKDRRDHIRGLVRTTRLMYGFGHIRRGR